MDLWLLALALIAAYPVVAAGICFLFIYTERRRYVRHHLVAQSDVADHHSGEKTVTIGVFHPYANGGGGGERVMYCALVALVKYFKELKAEPTETASGSDNKPRVYRVELLLYSGDDGLSTKELLDRAAERFNLPDLHQYRVDLQVRLVPLANREVLDPGLYLRFTLFWQSIAHIRLALTAFRTSEKLGLYPQVWIDTTGCPFSYLVASVRFGCTVVAYVHYPMISTDMIAKVQTRATDFNNNATVAFSSTRSFAKYIYYRIFAATYTLVGKYCTDIVMVNSTWTYNHVKQLWGGKPAIVYPPCGSMEEFMQFDIENREPLALSISQFRPEKNQLLQLQAMKVLLTKYATKMNTTHKDFKLIMLGSCRNADDEARIETLKEQCVELGLTGRVEFVVNASFAELKQYLARSSVGIHTMYNEHFGIGVVEMMAAGLLVVANNSGGPAADIVRPDTGYLALTADEYADKMLAILEQDASAARAMRARCRQASGRFSDSEFGAQFIAAMDAVLRRVSGNGDHGLGKKAM
uniref:GDP-Man:Man(3)GlcNAc(2)-PP-Dol alpha-1,2-mannosyltransferase n=1 Tax=Globisporangium ultimum (strain ATCC 200006 / CBS 805.95 / DAOM BR144) TaxID=431595 RepID=K3WWV0_GLOUD